MLHRFIYKDTDSGEEWGMPVTPPAYSIDHGRKVTGLTMHRVGELNLPGELALLDQTITYLLPANPYPFADPSAALTPFAYVERFERWSDAGTVLRFIVSGTPVNAAVILGPIHYTERDGTGDLYMTVPMRGYRMPEAEQRTATGTGNRSRAAESSPSVARQYVVQPGDTLASICRQVYGDDSLGPRLAAANGLVSVYLIQVGQILTIPPRGSLPTPLVNLPKSTSTAYATQLRYDPATDKYALTLSME